MSNQTTKFLSVLWHKMSILGSKVTKRHTLLPTLIAPFLNSQNLHTPKKWQLLVLRSFEFTFVSFNVYHCLKMSKSKFLGIVRWWLTSGMCKKTQVVWRMKTLPPEFMFELRLLKNAKMNNYVFSFIKFIIALCSSFNWYS